MAVVECAQIVACNIDKAFEDWLKVVWVGGGGMGGVTILEEGDANRVGCLRK